MKKLFVLLLSLCLVLSFAACKPSNDVEEEQTVTIWHTFTNDQQAYLEKAAADFNAAHEGKIKVEVVTQDNKGFTDKLYQSVMANAGPDIVFNYASESAKYIADGKVVDQSKYISKDLLATIDAGAYAEATSLAEPGMYVFPLVLTGPILFVNPTILSAAEVEVPTTWTEVYEAATKIHAYNGKYGFGFDSTTDGALTFISQAGAQTFDFDNNVCAFDTEAVRNTFALYQKGCLEGAFLPAPTDSYMSNDYNSENLAMYVGSCAGVPYLKADWAVYPLPQTEGGVEWTPAWNRGAIVFASNEAREKAACEFVEYFASPEVNAGWCEAMVALACMSGTREVESYKAFVSQDTPAVMALNALSPSIAGAFRARTASTYMRTAVQRLMADLATGMSVEEAIKGAYEYVADELAAE